MSKKATTAETETTIEDLEIEGATASILFIANAHLSEGGVHYKPGDSIPITPARAAALGSLVKPAEAV